MAKSFPSNERFELTSQIVRSAVSIPSNIAEGSGRTTNKEFARFLDIALGSAFELETQLIIASRIDNVSEIEAKNKIEKLQELQKMIKSFKSSLN